MVVVADVALTYVLPLQVFGNLITVKRLVQQEIDRFTAQRTGDLLSAAARGDSELVHTLLAQGLSPNVRDYDGVLRACIKKVQAMCVSARLWRAVLLAQKHYRQHVQLTTLLTHAGPCNALILPYSVCRPHRAPCGVRQGHDRGGAAAAAQGRQDHRQGHQRGHAAAGSCPPRARARNGAPDQPQG